MEVKALSRMNPLGVVVVVLSGLLKGLHHNNRVEEATKVEGDWVPREDVEAMREDVEAAMVGVVEAVECHNSSSMVGPKNIKAGEGEGPLSKEVVEIWRWSWQWWSWRTTFSGWPSQTTIPRAAPSNPSSLSSWGHPSACV